MPGIQTILHPSDFSENSRHAFEMACALARDNHAVLMILHVMIPSVSPVLQEPPPDPFRPAETQNYYARFPWPQPSDPQLRVEHRVSEGDPAEEILRLAEALHCDLIVMGTHGRTGLGRFLMGSVAEEVLRKSSCPVMVIKSSLRAMPGAVTETIAKPGEPIDVRPLGTSLAAAQCQRLVRTARLEVVRLIVRAGQEIPRHENQGDITVQCLEGRVAFIALGKTQTLEAGILLHLPGGEPHAIQAIEDSSLLLTIVAPDR
jgi:nucleotide-binding universal stress UspA family protein/quercetin dioxygenase-like cupin family protein